MSIITELIKSDPRLTPEEAAEFLGVKVDTLNKWRMNNRYDLEYVRIGRLIRYRLSALQRFLTDNTVGAVATAGV